MSVPAIQLSAKPLSASDISTIRARHPDAFKRPILKRFAAPFVLLGIILYAIYVSWFFSIGKVMSEGNWGIAGTYLADWISYEVRPDVDFRTGEIKIEYPRFSPLGSDPNPEWVTTKSGQVTVVTQSVTQNTQAQQPVGNSFMAPEAPATSQGSLETPADEGFSFMSPNSSASSAGAAASQTTQIDATTSETREGINEADVVFGTAGRINVTPTTVIVTRSDETIEFRVDPITETVTPLGNLPAWASQKTAGEKVFIDFGFAGRAEIRAKEVKIMRRFLGWENFFFDTNSPYWGKSFGEVVSFVFSKERIVENESNLSLAVDNFLNNAEWQHADVYIKLLQTIVMAFVGTLFAVIVAFPLSFLAARNITPNRFVNQFLKRFFDFFRSVDMLIWALFFTRAFGPGPLAGISAIFLTDTGTFGKLYAEALENIDDKQREGVKSVGASPAAVQRFGVVPQVLPIFASQALYFWESNTRSATIIGAVGAGGIGLKLWEAMRTNQDWENVFYMVILILIVVFLFDTISNSLRSRLVGGSQR